MYEQISIEKVLQKARHYCAWQERSHAEVKEKLYALGLKKAQIEEALATLIEENYLNEERFARAFAGGKFRMKQWGKKKIMAELKLKKISEYNIRTAMNEIDNEDYRNTMIKLLTAKWQSLKKEQYIARQAKTLRYMQQKGFEPQLVLTELNNIRKKNT
ncbi:MAG: RecX family transcriptional regulator [Chitinophagaceae bacterium]|nr:RecX family transcriptional regulator [Chitinophagaceae bacterium]